ncbi:MAG: hypothetical protein OEP48_01115 [Betaproteobacteria bacterium]|nr:hypothetical protein [Betaproteobacteria bacterium]
MEPTIWVAILVSALVHAALLSKWLPQIRFPSPEELERRAISPPLVVNLTPRRIIPPTPPSAPPPAPRVKLRPPTAAAPPPPAPPVIALERPAPRAPPPAPVKPPVAAPPSPPPVTAPKSEPRPAFDDLAAYIEAKRRARAASAPVAPPARPSKAPPEDEDARANRIVAENLGSQKNITFGYDPERNGGVFHVQLMSYDYAEFTFIGWNKEIRRITKQLIEVNKGDNSDIRIAVVRRMIAIIREQAPEDFLWDSQRVGYLTLSARLKDNKALEDFLMQEFFGEAGLWR